MNFLSPGLQSPGVSDGRAVWFSDSHREQFLRCRAYFPALRDVLVRAALRAACDRLDGVRLRDAVRVCRERARCEAPDRPSRFSAAPVARARVADGRLRRLCAPLAFLAEGVPFGGAGNFTPAFLALDNPIAIACLELRTPCFPSRT